MFGIELIYILVFAFLIDGIKLLYEAFTKYKYKELNGNVNDVSVIIPCYNEGTEIIKTIKSIVKHIPEKNIIVINDGSVDNTLGVLEAFNFKGILISTKNQGKVKAIQLGLNEVKTKFTLLLDADCRLDDKFILPTSLLNNSETTAVAFNIIPDTDAENIYKKFIIFLQKHEYAKSMQIGKKSKDAIKSIHCISGAGGLFKTVRLIELTKIHTKIFPGEDLERTLLELNANGKIVFCESTIKTSVLTHYMNCQSNVYFLGGRGLYRNIYLFAKILFKKNTHFILRLEMMYEIISLVTDILKIISLYLLLVLNSYLLLVIYLLYLIFEFIVYSKIHHIAKYYISRDMLYSVITILLYPLYSLYQMVLRIFSFLIFVKKKFITREWSKLLILLLFLFLPINLHAQLIDKIEKDTDKYIIGLKYQYVQDDIIDGYRKQDNIVAYFGLGNVYGEFSYGVLNQANVGIYTGPFWADIRFRKQDITTRFQGEYWLEDFVFKGVIQPTAIFKGDEKLFVSLGVGVDYYKNENFIISSLIMKDIGRFNTTTLIGKVQIGSFNSFWERTTLSINSDWDNGYSIELGYKFVYCSIEYYENYDFNSYNRMFITIGVLFRL